MVGGTPSERLEQIVHDSYGKLIAFLTSRNGNDIAAAEDALADALVRALDNWTNDNLPDNPQAWLLRVAHNRLLDGFRNQQVQKRMRPVLVEPFIMPEEFNDESIPDEQLRLLFACAHPAIDRAVRTPLVLQTVLGVQVERIAAAFLVSSRAMAQRLVRAKRKIRDAGIRLEIPNKRQLAERLQTVHETIYAAFNAADGGNNETDRGLAKESIHLAGLLVELLPGQPESMGLLALLLYIDSRRFARRNSNGDYVRLEEQAPHLWESSAVVRAEALLTEAAAYQRLGRFQLEAAIQSAHMQRLFGRPTPWPHILALYDALAESSSAIGIRVSRAAAMLQAEHPHDALEDLDEIDQALICQYQPYWAVRAFVLASLGKRDAIACFSRAIGLCHDPAIRSYLNNAATRLLEKRCDGH